MYSNICILSKKSKTSIILSKLNMIIKLKNLDVNMKHLGTTILMICEPTYFNMAVN